MNKTSKLRSIAFAAALTLAIGYAQAVSAGDPPPWLLDAAKAATPAFDVKDVSALVLRNEESVTIESDGRMVRTVRYALRILTKEGRQEAVARIVYQTDGEKVRDFDAWLIRKSGPAKSYGKKETIDMALADNDLYNEARRKLIFAIDDSAEGDVFGYESVTEERTIFSQMSFRFQDDHPVVFSKFTLNLPNGWRAESVTFNRDKIEAVVSGTSYSWELRDLAPNPYEAGSPSRSSLAPRLAVSFFPSQATATQIRTFSNWADVAKWMSEIEDPQMTVDDALAGKAKDLTAAATNEFERRRAISRYVQQLQYISIQIGTGKGGGYRPRSATEVFAKSYGDCKDKANLMRAMLSVLRIQAFLVSITADDPTYVRAEWASPHQFNHCIIAVKVSDETKAASVVVHPTLGRLLIFDPTDPYTSLGDLPEEQQGSLALIDHKDTDALLQMPVIPAELNRLDRKVNISLTPDGAIAGSLNEKTVGQAAVAERSRLRRLAASEYNQMIESWITRGASGAKTAKIETKDDHQNGDFNLDVVFSAASYGQLMQGRLMVFKPAVVGRLERFSFTDGKRKHPYLIDATTYSESVTIKLPAGFVVDEMPEPANLESAFGKYTANYEVKGDSLIFTRSLKLNRVTVPADKYETVRTFFGLVRNADQSPVVLLRK